MSQEPYPKEVKKTDLPSLVEKAKKSKRNGNIISFGMYMTYGIVAYLVSPVLLFFSGQVVISSYPQPVIFSTQIQIAIVITFFAVYASFLLFFILILEIAVRKITKLRYDLLVFFECILIADALDRKDREAAIKEVDGFVSWLHIFQSTAWYNSRAKRYQPEIKLLNSGRKELKRMLLFSTDRHLSDLFINFGTTLINNYDASAFSFLKLIIEKTGKYGKIEGWFDKIKGGATTLQIILYSISILIGIIISLITVLKLLGMI